jgi:hypothetical protein
MFVLSVASTDKRQNAGQPRQRHTYGRRTNRVLENTKRSPTRGMGVSVVSVVCCQVDRRIPLPQKCYQLWCIIVCDLETSETRRPWPELGCCTKENTKNYER